MTVRNVNSSKAFTEGHIRIISFIEDLFTKVWGACRRSLGVAYYLRAGNIRAVASWARRYKVKAQLHF